MFYQRFIQLCEKKGVSPSKAAQEAGLSKSTVTKWKHDPDARPTGRVIEKLTAYFDISASSLLDEEKEQTPEGLPAARREQVKFALFGGSGDITDAMYEEVLSFAAFVKQREDAKKKK